MFIIIPKQFENEKLEDLERYELELPKSQEVKKSNLGYIYVLKCKNLYKIGRTKNLQSRIRIYKTENPFGTKIILKKKVNNYIKKEKYLLEKFKSIRVRGEWFKLKEINIKEIKKYLNE